jgi:hypothetical protein
MRLSQVVNSRCRCNSGGGSGGGDSGGGDSGGVLFVYGRGQEEEEEEREAIEDQSGEYIRVYSFILYITNVFHNK